MKRKKEILGDILERTPKIGDIPPNFELTGDDNSLYSLKMYRGKKVVLYFYPKDDTSGCTTEACEFRDQWKVIQRAGVVVLGVSPDPVDSHARFKAKYRLPFPLLADTDHAIAEAYGVWGEKSMYGRKYFGIRRTTFIIGGTGKVTRVFEKVNPKGHAAEVLAAIGDEG